MYAHADADLATVLQKRECGMQVSVFMYVRTDVCTYIHLHTMHKSSHVHAYIHTYTHTGASSITARRNVQNLTYTCMHAYIHTYIHTGASIINARRSVKAHIHIHIYIHT